MLAALRKRFSGEQLGLKNGAKPLLLIVGGIAVIGGISGAWGDKRPVGGFFEAAIASALYVIVPFTLFYIGWAFGDAADEAYGQRWLSWAIGISVFILVGFVVFWLIESIPGVGWRWKSMLDSGEY